MSQNNFISSRNVKDVENFPFIDTSIYIYNDMIIYYMNISSRHRIYLYLFQVKDDDVLHWYI